MGPRRALLGVCDADIPTGLQMGMLKVRPSSWWGFVSHQTDWPRERASETKVYDSKRHGGGAEQRIAPADEFDKYVSPKLVGVHRDEVRLTVRPTARVHVVHGWLLGCEFPPLLPL